MKTMLKTLLLAVLATATLELPAPTAQEKTDTMREKAAALAAGSPLYMVNSVLDEMKDVIYWVDFNREMLGTHNNPAFRNDEGTY